MPSLIEQKMEEIVRDLNQIARCCYYAKSFNPSKDILAQLDQILRLLGVTSPFDVGLSNSILNKTK